MYIFEVANLIIFLFVVIVVAMFVGTFLTNLVKGRYFYPFDKDEKDKTE